MSSWGVRLWFGCLVLLISLGGGWNRACCEAVTGQDVTVDFGRAKELARAENLRFWQAFVSPEWSSYLQGGVEQFRSRNVQERLRWVLAEPSALVAGVAPLRQYKRSVQEVATGRSQDWKRDVLVASQEASKRIFLAMASDEEWLEAYYRLVVWADGVFQVRRGPRAAAYSFSAHRQWLEEYFMWNPEEYGQEVWIAAREFAILARATSRQDMLSECTTPERLRTKFWEWYGWSADLLYYFELAEDRISWQAPPAESREWKEEAPLPSLELPEQPFPGVAGLSREWLWDLRPTGWFAVRCNEEEGRPAGPPDNAKMGE